MSRSRFVHAERGLCVRRACAALSALCVLALASCARSEPTSQRVEGELVVFAASSLRDVFSKLAGEFARTHAGARVTFNFAGTQELRTQLAEGAAVDVFASADRRSMDEVVRARHVSEPRVFARNEPVLVVARESAALVRQLADLPKATRIVVGTPEVPIGRYTMQILERANAQLGTDFGARVEAAIVSRELNVRQVLTKVSLGEAQAGFVYRTDAQRAAGSVEVVTIPPSFNVMAEYPIALLSDAPHPQLARAWLDLVFSAKGQRALQEAGFLSPFASVAAP